MQEDQTEHIHEERLILRLAESTGACPVTKVENNEDDLAETQANLSKDKVSQADLSKGCDTEASEGAARSKTRAEEPAALEDTIRSSTKTRWSWSDRHSQVQGRVRRK